MNNKSLDFIMCNYKVNDAINKIQYEVSLNKYALNPSKINSFKTKELFAVLFYFDHDFIKNVL